MDCSNCAELQKKFEDKKSQVSRYEEKIKDLVNAYKSLTTEKQSLEVALSLLSPAEETGDRKVEEGQSSANPESGTGADNSKQEKQVDQLDALKQTISTLTLVNKRKEMEFRKDRLSLVEAKNELQTRCDELEQRLNSQKQQNRSQNLKLLRAQLTETQAAHEKAMSDHGLVLAELQRQYTKEKRHSEGLEKQVTEMSQRLATKDALIKQAEKRLKQVDRMEQEVEALRRKAELTPTARVMRDELVNVKSSCDQELSMLRTRNAMQSAQLRERDSRVEQLEQRIGEMSERCAEAERRSIELEAKLAEMQKAEERRKMEEAKTTKETENNTDLVDTLDQFRALFDQLMKQQPNFDPIDVLGLDTFQQKSLPIATDLVLLPPPASVLDCLSPASSTPALCSGAPPSRNESSVSLDVFGINVDHPPTPAMDGDKMCNLCQSSRKELYYFKSLIGHMQKKLGNLEENHERMKKEHDSAAEVLRERILELENSQHRTYAQLTAEARQKVTELEEELNKQRARVVEVMAEKDREIEFTKNSLAALYARNYGQMGAVAEKEENPMDPQPKGVQRSNSDNWTDKAQQNQPDRTELRRKDTAESFDSCKRRPSIGECSIVAGTPTPMDFSASFVSSASRRLSRGSLLAGMGESAVIGVGTATRNLFYEQELCKREQEISELRNVIRLLELKVRDIEQAMLMKDIQYLQIIEALKEEIRVLEGRLTLASSQTNMAYLRNIFIQFLNQGSASGRKHILKAIGAVLQLTQIEMRRIERWTH